MPQVLCKGEGLPRERSSAGNGVAIIPRCVVREGGASVAVAYEGGQVTLRQTGGATDAKFTDGRTTLYLDGDRALLDIGGQILARGCVKR